MLEQRTPARGRVAGRSGHVLARTAARVLILGAVATAAGPGCAGPEREATFGRRSVPERPALPPQIEQDVAGLLDHGARAATLLEATGDDPAVASAALGAYLRVRAPGVRRAHARLAGWLADLDPPARLAAGEWLFEQLRPTLTRMRGVFRDRPALRDSEALRRTLEQAAWNDV
jgi:hypothetical protein